MPDSKDKKQKTEKRSNGMRKGSGQGGRGDGLLQKKARSLLDGFGKKSIEENSAAAEIITLRNTLRNMVTSENGEIKEAAQQLLNQTEQLISDAKKYGKAISLNVSTQAITQQVNKLAKQIGSIESTLGGYKIKYVQAYQKSLESFDQRWTVMFPPIVANPAQDKKIKEIPDKLKNVKTWDAYMDAFLGDNVEKGKEKENLAKAMSGMMLKQQNKPFSLEEADKLAANILQSEAFQKTFGKNGRLVESYLKNRNISQAILQMNEQIDKDAVKKMKKEQDLKYKEFNEFLSLHPALKIGYGIISKEDANKGTSNAQKMVEDYHTAKQNKDDMTEARIMTKLLQTADPVLQKARNNESLDNAFDTKEPETPVLKPHTDGE